MSTAPFAAANSTPESAEAKRESFSSIAGKQNVEPNRESSPAMNDGYNLPE
jgi:hypothetical protein